MKSVKFQFLAVVVPCLLIMAITAHGVTIGVDEILFEDDITNPGNLSGSVDMTLEGSLLTILLRNTSDDTGLADDAGNLLTGIGFSLPSGVSILGGTVFGDYTGGGVEVDLSSEWGYSVLVDSGHFDAPPAGDGPATLPVNTVVSTMVADSDVKFADGYVLDPEGLNGPEFGIRNTSSASGSGLASIWDVATIKLGLTTETGSVLPSDLIDQINAGNVVLSFGSPGSSSVPDGGATIGLLGLALLGLRSFRSRKSS